MKKRELTTCGLELWRIDIDNDSSGVDTLPSLYALTPPTGENDTMAKENEHAR